MYRHDSTSVPRKYMAVTWTPIKHVTAKAVACTYTTLFIIVDALAMMSMARNLHYDCAQLTAVVQEAHQTFSL